MRLGELMRSAGVARLHSRSHGVERRWLVRRVRESQKLTSTILIIKARQRSNENGSSKRQQRYWEREREKWRIQCRWTWKPSLLHPRCCFCILLSITTLHSLSLLTYSYTKTTTTIGLISTLSCSYISVYLIFFLAN